MASLRDIFLDGIPSSAPPTSTMALPAHRKPSSTEPTNSCEENLDDPGVIVGSPDHVDLDEHRTPQRSNVGLIGSRSVLHSRGATDARPSLAQRSISSPQPLLVRRRAGTTTSRITSGLLNLTPAPSPAARPPVEHQWSLFGQLMENEGQLRTPSSAQRRSGRRSSNAHGRSIPSGDVTPGDSVGDDPFLTFNVQSPVVEEETFNNCLASPTSGAQNENDDSDSDSESDASSISTVVSAKSASGAEACRHPWYSLERLPTVPLLYRNIFKCALAYFIASLFTYSPYLSGFISDLVTYGPGDRAPLPSGHMVATVAVYFNPAKTMGAMIEADLFCTFGVFYSAFVSLASMSMFWWLELKPGWEWLADVLVILWIGVSMSFLAWMKVWMENPQFNTACSMIAIIIFVVLVKEGGLETLLQVTFIIFCGSSISNIVCYLVWPQSATANLQTNMTSTLDSFSTLLTLLTHTFLLEEGIHQPSQEKLQRAVEKHQDSFTSLKKNLKDAKSEWRFWFRASGAPKGKGRTAAYEDAVDSLTRLAQHLNGLRGGTRLQYELTKAGVVGKKKKNGLDPIGKNKAWDEEDDEETVMLKAAAVMFGDLVDDLGPPLKALSTTCTSSLKRLREAFVLSQLPKKRPKKGAFEPHEFAALVDGIEKALVRFESTSNHAVLRLYRKSYAPSVSLSESTGSLPTGVRASTYSENGMLVKADNEHVFLVYFFIFTLQEFSRELVSLVDAMERIYSLEQHRLNWRSWWTRMTGAIGERQQSLKQWWRSERPQTAGSRKRTGLQRKLSAYILPQSRHPRPSFPKVRPHAPNTIQTPARSNLPFIGRLKQSIWSIGTRLNERDTKFAVKAGMATAMLAAPAFFDSTRPLFVAYYGDWALISFFVVISPTIGATNFLSVHRVIGTLFGAAVAAGIYTLFPENAPVLSIFGFFFSLPCFYYIVATPQYASSGRFVLLTYNLTCLYCYNLRQKDVSAPYVAFHRALAVTIGVTWAALVSRFWWPSEARRELSKALSEFCLNIGWLYTRLVTSNSFAPELNRGGEESEDSDTHPSEGTSLLAPVNKRLDHSIREFMAMELHLQIKLIEIQGLLAQTQHEPRLKGPFPVQLYRGILTSLQTILDRLHSMRCVTTREEWYTSVRQDFIVPVNKERHEMVGNIILYLSTLSAAFRLKAPLPPYLPPAEKSRQRLVDAIRSLDVVRNRDVKGSRQLLFFAYALTMQGVTQELESLGRTLQGAFGVIGQTPEEFEALFMDPGEARRRLDFAA